MRHSVSARSPFAFRGVSDKWLPAAASAPDDRMITLLLLLAIIRGCIPVEGQCSYQGRAAPPPGQCAGPLARVLAKREAVLAVNRGCSIVAFLADSDAHAELE